MIMELEQKNHRLRVHEIFEQRVFERPDRIALSMGCSRLGYSELNAWAEEIAAELSEARVGAGSLVGLFMERSFEMVAAMIAILKVGATYVPLDPNYPPERIELLANDSGVSVILLQDNL